METWINAWGFEENCIKMARCSKNE